MSANWVDLFLVVLVGLIVMAETRRGFGKAVFDLVAAFVALRLADWVYNDASTSFLFLSDTTTNKALIYSLLFVIVGSICLIVGKTIYDRTQISLEMFDPVLGMVLGIAMAVIIGHAFTNTLVIIGTVDGRLPDVLTGSTLGIEFYDFTTYRNVVSVLTRLAA